jgi:putative tributyrin esterase
MINFKTIEISDSRFERNGLKFVTVKSDNLKGRGDICIFSPDTELANLPVLILLHGVYGSSWAWSMKGGVHITAQRMINEDSICPMVIAMPSDGLWGDGSGYVSHSGADFEKWIAEDVVSAVRETVPAAGDRSKWFIGGLSMGGYGAIRIGARYPKQFAGISAHSAITHLSEFASFVEEPISAYGDLQNVGLLQTILHNRDTLPALRFDCGIQDDLIHANRELHTQLSEHGISHDFEELSGAHEWPYWEKNVSHTLSFVSRQSIPKISH